MGVTVDFSSLVTEERNSNTMQLDNLDTYSLVSTVQAEDFKVAEAVKAALPQITAVIDICTERLKHGGRMIYFGAGTSGRIGLLDAAECSPTFGVDNSVVQAFIAGGREAMWAAFESAEDSIEMGMNDAKKANITNLDVVIGIASSGRTPYVIGAVKEARTAGALTVAVVNNEHTELGKACDYSILALVGPEALTGSTRMKSASSQKMILNLISTCTMVKLGKVYENLMIDLKPSNLKLRERAITIVTMLACVSRHDAEGALVASRNCVKTAIVMLKRKLNRSQAQELIEKCDGFLRKALNNQ